MNSLILVTYEQRMDLSCRMVDADIVLEKMQKHGVVFEKKYTMLHGRTMPSTITFTRIQTDGPKKNMMDLATELHEMATKEEIGNVYILFPNRAGVRTEDERHDARGRRGSIGEEARRMRMKWDVRRNADRDGNLQIGYSYNPEKVAPGHGRFGPRITENTETESAKQADINVPLEMMESVAPYRDTDGDNPLAGVDIDPFVKGMIDGSRRAKDEHSGRFKWEKSNISDDMIKKLVNRDLESADAMQEMQRMKDEVQSR